MFTNASALVIVTTRKSIYVEKTKVVPTKVKYKNLFSMVLSVVFIYFTSADPITSRSLFLQPCPRIFRV